MKKLISFFCAFVFALLPVGPLADVYAATPGEHLTGTDPVSTGCSKDTKTVKSVYIRESQDGTILALLELR
ncbi:MAG: hypothetical protein WB502_15645 [Thermoactinomyces sp.]